jgi:hypothetical protein
MLLVPTDPLIIAEQLVEMRSGQESSWRLSSPELIQHARASVALANPQRRSMKLSPEASGSRSMRWTSCHELPLPHGPAEDAPS